MRQNPCHACHDAGLPRTKENMFMDELKIITELRAYRPRNEQEAADRDEIVRQIEHFPNIFTRENRNAHMTASSWIVNRERTKVLMVYHNIYDSWSWVGGHADGETDLLAVALREAKEETGLTRVTPVYEQIYSVEILTVDGHEKRGRYVSSHLHLNVTYLLEADENEPLRGKPDENKGAAWFTPEGAVRASSEPWFRARIYPKLNDGLKKL